MHRFGIIYRARCVLTEKLYVGYTIKSLARRKQEHLRNSLNKNYKLSCAIRKYGWDNFEWGVIKDRVPLYRLEEQERFYIWLFDAYKNGYNSTLGGEGQLGLKHSTKTKEHLRQINTGRKHTAKSIQKMCLVQSGLNKHYGEETRRKIGLASKDRKSLRFTGKKHTEETKAIIGSKGKGRKHSRESIERRAQIRSGVKLFESSSGFVGVSWQKSINRWRAKFQDKYLGVFKTEEQAAQRYNEEAIKVYGNWAKLNNLEV